jgi:hypothetical protein
MASSSSSEATDITTAPSLLQRVLEPVDQPLTDPDDGHSRLGVVCVCSCGNEIIICVDCLLSGKVTSCGEC